MSLFARTRTGLSALTALLAATLLLGLAPGAGGTPATQETDTDYGRMLLVLDSSGSMAERAAGGGSKMQAAKRALTQVVGELPAESQVGLRVYGATVFDKRERGACRDSQLVVEPGTENRDQLRQAIDTFKPYGETPIAHALQEAAKDLGDEGRRSIVLVSDGIATCQPDPCTVAADLAADGIDLQIDVIGLGVEGSARNQLQCIAGRGNGTYYNVDTAQEIVETLARVSTRAVRPFSLSGTQVQGTAGPDEAPTITGGQWTDHLGPHGAADAVRHYRIERQIPGSTVHVVATTRGTPGEWDGLELTLTDEMGAMCRQGRDSRNVNRYAILSAQTSTGQDEQFPVETCWQEDTLLAMVERGNDSDTRRAPISLTVFEEPPVRGADALPEWAADKDYVAPKVSGKAEEVVAGTSFADAPRLGTGVYALDIVPGESQIVKVPLAWGQQFTARAVFPAGVPGVQELTGVQGPFADIKIYSSLTGATSGAYSGTNGTAIMPGSAPAELTAMTPVVRYRNRQASGNTTYLPGDHFLVISANEDSGGDSWVQPYKLAIEVLGEEAGVPAYADGASVTQPLEQLAAADVETEAAPAEDPTPATDGPGEDAAGSSALQAEEEPVDVGYPVMVLVSALVILLLVALAVIVYLLRRRKDGQPG